MGFYALILLAGLQAIPKDLYEAAEMDGTRPARVFWRITLPLLAPNLLVVIVLALIRAVQIFDEVYVLTGGGPGTSTMFLTQYIYETGFASHLRNPGLAAAASILMGAVLVVLTLMQLGLARRSESRERANEPRSREFILRRRGGKRLALDRHRHLGLADRRADLMFGPALWLVALVVQVAGRSSPNSRRRILPYVTAERDGRGLRQAARRSTASRSTDGTTRTLAEVRRIGIVAPDGRPRRNPARSSRSTSRERTPVRAIALRHRRTTPSPSPHFDFLPLPLEFGLRHRRWRR